MQQLQLHCLSFLKNDKMDITKMRRQEVAPAVWLGSKMPTNKGCTRTQFFHAEQATC